MRHRQWIGAAAGVALAIVVSIYIGTHAPQSVSGFVHTDLPFLGLPVVVWLAVSEQYDVTLTVLILYLGLLDGVVKLTSGSSLGTLGRDLLLWAICTGALIRIALRRRPVQLPRETIWIVAWVAVCLVQLPNPGDTSMLHALVSLRPHLEFVPLFFFGYTQMRSERALRTFLILLVVIAAINGLVTLVQSTMTPEQLASWGPGYSQLEFGGGGFDLGRLFVVNGISHVRPPGLGGADGAGAGLAAMALPALLALFLDLKGRWRWALIAFGAIPIFIGLAFGESRSAIVVALLSALIFAALTLGSRRGLIALLAVALVAGGGYVFDSLLISNGPNRYSTAQLAQGEHTRESSARDAIRYLHTYPLGDGLGSVGAGGASAIGGTSTKQLDGDNEFGFLVIETGIPGLLVMLGIWIGVARRGIRLRRIRSDGLQRPLAAITAVFLGFWALWLDGPITSTSPGSPFIWFAAGVLVYWAREVRCGRVSLRGGLMSRIGSV